MSNDSWSDVWTNAHSHKKMLKDKVYKMHMELDMCYGDLFLLIIYVHTQRNNSIVLKIFWLKICCLMRKTVMHSTISLHIFSNAHSSNTHLVLTHMRCHVHTIALLLCSFTHNNHLPLSICECQYLIGALNPRCFL